MSNFEQYILADRKVDVSSVVEAKKNRFQCYKSQGLCTTMFGKEETVQMHQLEK